MADPGIPSKLLKVSPQGQVTLTRAIWEAMGEPSHVLAEFVNPNLLLKPARAMTLEEAERRYARHGITAEVLAEALRIVARRNEATSGSEG
jgi:hypothetical protein